MHDVTISYNRDRNPGFVVTADGQSLIISKANGFSLYPPAPPFVFQGKWGALEVTQKHLIIAYKDFKTIDLQTGAVEILDVSDSEQTLVKKIDGNYYRLYQDQGFGGWLPNAIQRLPLTSDGQVIESHSMGTLHNDTRDRAAITLRTTDGEITAVLAQGGEDGMSQLYLNTDGSKVAFVTPNEYVIDVISVYDCHQNNLTTYDLNELNNGACTLGFDPAGLCWCLNDSALIGSSSWGDAQQFYMFDLRTLTVYWLGIQGKMFSSGFKVFQDHYLAYTKEAETIHVVDLNKCDKIICNGPYRPSYTGTIHTY